MLIEVNSIIQNLITVLRVETRGCDACSTFYFLIETVDKSVHVF